MKLLFYIVLAVLLLSNCGEHQTTEEYVTAHSSITCTENGCEGVFEGLEFLDGADVAHQFSNRISDSIGGLLKQLYHKGVYSRVDFSGIEMATRGMGSGNVVYSLKIPLERVSHKCAAYTAFDHSGGWNHSPELAKRRNSLQSALVSGERLKLSTLQKTEEGLQEYWIQWRHKEVQSDCF